MRKLMTLFLSLVVGSAFVEASGWACISPNGNLRIRMLNHVEPENGTMNLAVVVLSTSFAPDGLRTIGRFSPEEGTASRFRSDDDTHIYELIINPEAEGQADKPHKFVGPHPVSSIAGISVEVPFTYTRPVEHGTVLTSILTITFNDGSAPLRGKIDCKRYLKQEEKGLEFPKPRNGYREISGQTYGDRCSAPIESELIQGELF